MSQSVFVDTGAWFAAVVPWDENHAAAAKWFAGNQRPLLTTDYVVTETLTLLRVRGEDQRAVALGDRFFHGRLVTVEFLTQDQVRAAWQVFRKFRDKQWSFTDCTSKVVIEEANCVAAVAFDQHFRQFGTVPVVP
jgi:predicted nucleic acid-binding protein